MDALGRSIVAYQMYCKLYTVKANFDIDQDDLFL